MSSLTRRVAAALVAAPLFAVATPAALPPAAAQPDPVIAEVDPAIPPSIGWSLLGMSDRFDIIGANIPVDQVVPVPNGVQPTLLTGQIGSVANIGAGRVDVLDGRGVVLGSIPVPTDVPALPFEIDLSAAAVVDGQAKLTFVLRDWAQPGDVCNPPGVLTLSQLATRFSGGVPAPVNVAEFLPGYLDEILIHVGPEPTVDQQQAALDLVAELTRIYRPIPVRIGVVTGWPEPAPFGLTRRVIDLRVADRPGIVLEQPGTKNATLVISGPGPRLVEQVRLFADRRYKMAQNHWATTLSAADAPVVTSTLKRFGELGIGGQASVLGTHVLYTGFDVAAFGVGPISGAKVHLLANHTPVVGGEASLLVRVGSSVLASQPLGESGTVDLTFDVPAEAITSNVGIALELRYIPRQQCSPYADRMTFVVDPTSTVDVTPGTVNRGGFPALPMGFAPDFAVAVDQPDRIRFAAQAVNLLGQQTTVTLRPRVRPLDEAVASETGLLLVADPDTLRGTDLAPPVLPESPETSDINGPVQTTVDLAGPLGLVQAFTDHRRSVLAITGSGDWTLVDADFDYIRRLPDRWASLTGDVLATGIAGQTVNLAVVEGGTMAHQPNPGPGWQRWAWLSAGLTAAAVVAAGAVLLQRRRTAKD